MKNETGIVWLPERFSSPGSERSETPLSPPVRGRGRPRKNPVVHADSPQTKTSDEEEQSGKKTNKRESESSIN